MSSPVKYLDVLLKIPPDDVLYDFLAQCGLTLPTLDANVDEGICKTLRIVVEIERAPLAVRTAIIAGLQKIAMLADDSGLGALRAAAAGSPDRVNPLHLADAPAQCALWMFLRHRDLFDEACRMTSSRVPAADNVPLDYVRQPLTLPDDPSVCAVRLREVTLLDETTGGEITIKASTDLAAMGVHDLLATWIPNDNPIQQDRFRVITATIELMLLPEASGRSVRRRAQLVLRHRGGHNLTEFSFEQQTRLSAWLSNMKSAVARASSVGYFQRAA